MNTFKTRISTRARIVIASLLATSMAFAAVAVADQLSVDGDVAVVGTNNPVSLTAAPGETVSTTAGLSINWQGSRHVVAGSTVNFGVDASETNLPAGYTVANTSVVVPTGAGWNDNSDSTSTAQSAISFTAPATPGPHSYTVGWTSNESCTSTPCLNSPNLTINLTVTAPTNHAPVVSSAASPNPVTGYEGGALTAGGAFTDEDNDPLTLSLGAGNAGSLAGSPTANGGGPWSWSYTPTDNGSGSVTVTADDGHVGGTASDSFNWSAANVAPTASITGAPTTSPEGTQISLGSSVTDPSSVDTSAGFTHAWSVTKNGVAYGASGSGANFSFTPDDEGTYVVSFSAKDKDDGEGTDSKTITVTNVAPSNVTASFGPALSCTAAANATLSWSFADPGADTWDAQIDWNYDGTTFAPDETKTNVAKSDSATHSYGSAGTHVAAIRISDGDGGSSNVQTATLTVNYNLSSILQPVNDTRNGQQTSMFKYGSTVPVKVEITDCDGSHPSNLDVRVTYAKTASNPPPVGTEEAVATNAPDGGNQMRFSDPIYIFNFGTKYINDSTATVRIDVSIPTTGQYTFAHIGLKAK